MSTTSNKSLQARTAMSVGSLTLTGSPIPLTDTETLYVRLLFVPSTSITMGDSVTQPFTIGAGVPFNLEVPAGGLADMQDVYVNGSAGQTVKYLRFH